MPEHQNPMDILEEQLAVWKTKLTANRSKVTKHREMGHVGITADAKGVSEDRRRGWVVFGTQGLGRDCRPQNATEKACKLHAG